MVESKSPGILEKIQPAIGLLSEMVNLGLEVIRGLIDGGGCQNGIFYLLIQKLAQPMRLIFMGSTET
jgi:hypothetical protein